SRLTIISGDVSRLRIRLMFSERRSGVSLSRLLLLYLSNDLRRLHRIFGNEPLQHFQLIGTRSAANLNQKLLERWPVQCQIPCAFIAHGTNGSQIGWLIATTHRFVNDVAN